MIARLRGEVLEVGGDSFVLDCQGVGYEVHAPEPVLVGLARIGEFVEVFVRQVFREDSVTLYGFLTREDRRLFDLLVEVKGCGPRTALAILGTLGFESTLQAIQMQDARLMTRPSGVGPRLAERILLELREKVMELGLERKIQSGSAVASVRVSEPGDELVEALMALGLRRAEAEIAAAEARSQSDLLEDQIRLALRSRSKN
ncbi:MAG TPA: Holliday junction branch migration protein RuvA [Fimbriimonadaceae bacterium]|nr:Holliday junction branch migration protein RuvA [Fimbriimonadaceae bacterium]HRJ32069.1 Holliday junction branch migration protein RuvA [Fimbriimonadaceae bacterium]